MHSPTLALLWQTWGRHRWGLATVAAGLYGLIAFQRSLPPGVWMAESQAALFSLPIGGVVLYLFYAFSYAESGRRGKGSSFPHWMLTLPVPTWKLVLPPMLSGMAAIALAWVVAAYYLLQAVGLEVPLAGPALALAFTIGCVQALEWSPLRTRVKFLLAVGVLGGVWYALFQEAWQTPMLVAMPLLLLLVVAGGVASVGLARQGGSAGSEQTTASEASARRRELAPFASAARAQLWLECRRNLAVLPGGIACWMALLTLLLLLTGKESLPAALQLNVFLLPYLCILIGCLLGKTDVWDRPLRITSYAAGRPINSGDMVAAKLQMTALGLFVTLVLIALTMAAWIVWLGDSEALERFYRQLVPPGGRGVAFAVPLTVTALVGVTWLQLAGHLFAGLAGRVWVLAAVVVSYLVVVPNLLALNSGWQAEKSDAARVLSELLPWLFGGLVGVKFAAAVTVFRTTLRRGLFNGYTVAILVSIWLAVVFCLAGMLFGDNPEHWQSIPTRELVLAVSTLLLCCPLTRIGLAPLALEWNRRR